jgi:hypothetical protein
MNQPADNAKQPDAAHRVQGEGDYDAARRYDKATTDFANSGKVDEAARDAKPTSPAEADELRRAENEGKSHAKGEDPQLHRPGKDSSRQS